MEIIRAETGTDEQVVDVETIVVPDLWHLAQVLEGPQKAIVLECWHLAHDMLGALRTIATQDASKYIPSPIHTK